MVEGSEDGTVEGMKLGNGLGNEVDGALVEGALVEGALVEGDLVEGDLVEGAFVDRNHNGGISVHTRPTKIKVEI